MEKLQWFERVFVFGIPPGMLPSCIERLEGTLVRIEQKVIGISEDELSEKVDGKWSIKENIGHLAEVDEVALQRIDQMLTGVSPMLPAVFEPKSYDQWPIRRVVEYFRQTRRKNVARYTLLDPEQLLKQSLHPRLKAMMSPVDLAWFDAEHDDHHLVRINEIINKLKA